jgi:hypothetical protein
MKFLVAWDDRDGLDDAQAAELLAAFGRWTPPTGLVFHQFLNRADGRGGFAVVETDSPTDLLDAPSKFGPWLEFDIVPVVDIADGVAVLADALEFRALGA